MRNAAVRVVAGAAVLAVAPHAARAQAVMGRVVDSATGRPLAHVSVRLVRADSTASDSAVAEGETAADGAFALGAPAPGRYRVRLGTGHLGPPLALASADAVDQHEYRIGAEPPSRVVSHPLHGAALDSALRTGRALFACEVDVPADTLPRTVAPLFPAVAYLQRYAAASVLTEFVVDTAGRTEPATVRVWRTRDTDGAFATSARSAVLNARFSPAVADGRRVRQVFLLAQTFHTQGAPEPAKITGTGCGPVDERHSPDLVPAR